MKYSKWIGILTGLTLIVICFLPWTYHADVDKVFTGFFSEKNAYGKPGKFLVLLAIAFIILTFISKLWAKRINLFIAAIMVSYAIKTYILYTSCYNAYCPEKRAGIYIMLLCNIVILLVSVFPYIKPDKNNSDESLT